MSPTLPDPMLEGMPGPGSLRLLAHEGKAVVLSGRWVLFRFPVADTGMRRLAMVALTEAGHPVKTVATVFGVHPNGHRTPKGRSPPPSPPTPNLKA